MRMWKTHSPGTELSGEESLALQDLLLSFLGNRGLRYGANQYAPFCASAD